VKDSLRLGGRAAVASNIAITLIKRRYEMIDDDGRYLLPIEQIVLSVWLLGFAFHLFSFLLGGSLSRLYVHQHKNEQSVIHISHAIFLQQTHHSRLD
jgi:hypothetical protein